MAEQNNNELTIEQLRKKYRSEGYNSLTAKEKIRLFLSYSEKGGNIDKTADNIIKTYGNIHTSADSGASFLINVCNISMSSAVLLSLIPAFSNIYNLNRYNNIKLNSSRNAKKFFHALMKHNQSEESAIVALNSRFDIINQIIVSDGEPDKVHIQFRKVYEFAKTSNAKYIIIAHCHLNSDATPSQSDINTTLKIKEVINLAGVLLADHIITSTENTLSMREYMLNDIFDATDGYITTDEQ